MDSPGRLRPHRHRSRPEIKAISSVLRFAALGFDIDHTLGIDNKLERIAFLRLLGELCSQGGRALGTLASESARVDELLERQRGGAFPIDEAVARFVTERGAKETGRFIARYKEIAVGSVRDFFVPQPDARTVLTELQRRRIPCAILSNGWSPLQQEKARRLCFEGPVLVSDAIGAQKPQARAFAALSQALGVSANEIAYVGDNPRSDIAAAQSCAMQGIWFDTESVRYAPDLPKPDAVIHSLTELLAFL